MRHLPGQLRHPVRRGFTLIEAALVTVIIGVGVMAMMQLLAAGTVANADATSFTTAMNLARNVREYALQRSFSQVQAMNGQTYSPAIDSRGAPARGLLNWSQTVTVQSVDINRLTAAVASSSPAAVRVTVTVNRQNNPVCNLTWYAFAPTP